MNYRDVIAMHLRVMDSTAVSLCMEHELPIMVIDINQPGHIRRSLMGEPVGSIIGPGETRLAVPS